MTETLKRGRTVIRACTCKHEFQDKEHGKQMRVHNVGKDDKLTCTVCGSRK